MPTRRAVRVIGGPSAPLEFGRAAPRPIAATGPESLAHKKAGPEGPASKHSDVLEETSKNTNGAALIGFGAPHCGLERAPARNSGRLVHADARRPPCPCRRAPAGCTGRTRSASGDLVRMGHEVAAALRALGHRQHAVVDELDQAPGARDRQQRLEALRRGLLEVELVGLDDGVDLVELGRPCSGTRGCSGTATRGCSAARS